MNTEDLNTEHLKAENLNANILSNGNLGNENLTLPEADKRCILPLFFFSSVKCNLSRISGLYFFLHNFTFLQSNMR